MDVTSQIWWESNFCSSFQASNEQIDERKVKYTDNDPSISPAAELDKAESFSVNKLISKFENKASTALPVFDDHAIVDDVDVRKLSVIWDMSRKIGS